MSQTSDEFFDTQQFGSNLPKPRQEFNQNYDYHQNSNPDNEYVAPLSVGQPSDRKSSLNGYARPSSLNLSPAQSVQSQTESIPHEMRANGWNGGLRNEYGQFNNQFNAPHQFSQTELGQSTYDQTDYGTYSQSTYGQNEYGQSEYANYGSGYGEYGQSEYTQYGQSEYGQSEYGQAYTQDNYAGNQYPQFPIQAGQAQSFESPPFAPVQSYPLSETGAPSLTESPIDFPSESPIEPKEHTKSPESPEPTQEPKSDKEQKKDDELGIGIGSIYVQQLRAEATETHIPKMPASLPLGLRRSAQNASSVQVKPEFLRRAMDIRYKHLPRRMLELEVDDDEQNNEQHPFQGAQPAMSIKSETTEPRPSSPVESIVEQPGKIKLFVANPDSD